MEMHRPQRKKAGGPRLVPGGKGDARLRTGKQPDIERASTISAVADPRYREIVNVTTALRLAWGLLNDPAYDGTRTSVANLRLMAVIDRALSRMDEVLDSWEKTGERRAETWNEGTVRRQQA